MKTLKLEIKGIGPLLQHDDKLANPLGDYAKQFQLLAAKKGRRDENDLKEMLRIEWFAALYHTPEQGYFMKSDCFEGAFYDAAKALELEKLCRQTVRIPDSPQFHFPDEALSPEELFLMDEYKDVRTVNIQNKKVPCCRPLFNEWSCTVDVLYDEERIDAQQVKQIADYAGQYKGLCDYRPRFGKFRATVIE